MEIGLMVEGQNGLTWERWLHILRLAERLGFPTVFRSDHYFIGPQQDSLEAYLSFAVAARETSRIRFGPLVSPVTFRTPVDVARMAAQIDLLSGGRFVMGLGAGWNEAEHRAYGIPFPPIAERFARLEEAIRLMQTAWREGPANFAGRFYRLEGANLLPKPAPGRPPILIGGTGEKKTLRLAARYADEWNAVNVSPEVYAQKVAVLERHCEAEGRDPATIRRSMMTFAVIGPDERTLDRATERMMTMWGARPGTTPAEYRAGLRARGMIVGGNEEVLEALGRYAALGLQEVQFQHFLFDDDTVPEYLAAEIARAAKGL
ncbi:LLM class F420-dependent oxidoreductase [Tepidiforma sp.]|uniref:LLM class F420-dependent oxidoreductase n=1 Tax=Tepidiforma sp. TaxID=2682230 RepID=UPI00261B2629|nr:LLM class F420-dependent oxidoreductase [Tepidiforma sp.]MCX7617061.1 LLM class F420-dependent oxidoreductase [Tepidiforma sp.]